MPLVGEMIVFRFRLSWSRLVALLVRGYRSSRKGAKGAKKKVGCDRLAFLASLREVKNVHAKAQRLQRRGRVVVP